MGRQDKSMASAAFGVLVLVCLSTVASAQGAPQVLRVASAAAGSIGGVVRDEKGAAVSGAVVSALGPTTAVAVTDRGGRFELRTLSPGPYVLRAHLTGFVASRGQIVEVRSSARASSSIALHRVANAGSQPVPILAAGIDLGSTNSGLEEPAEPAGAVNDPRVDDDHGEVAWRLRHARRGILKDATLADGILGDSSPTANGFGNPGFFGSTGDRSAPLASTLFNSTPFSGQVNLLTAGSFDTPQRLFSTDSFARSIAFFSLGAPAGEHADWAVRGALTQGDISSWIVAAAYTTRAPARHQYEAGMSYATARYDGGNLAALRDVADGRRNVGALYGFDRFTIAPAASVTYGARFSHYDYLAQAALLSPRLLATVSPVEGFRIDAVVSRRALAPGAEEFVPPVNSPIWLPPQRTFSSLEGRGLEAEHTDHFELRLEHDIEGATLSIRAFRQHVTDQLATLFGIDMPNAAHLGHYFVANTGDVDAAGWTAGFRTPLTTRVQGSVEYTLSRAHSRSADNLGYLNLLAPSVIRSESERVHDVSTKLEAELPETLTRVAVLYRVSNAFAAAGDRPVFDSRFDVQVRQSLPFMDFGSAKWEMLLAVRSLFREASADSSIYDELLVVRPPKRIVGGVTLHF